MRILPKLVLCLILASGWIACSSSAPRRPPEEPEIILATEADDRRAGKRAAELVRSELGIVENRDLTDYVDRIGRRLLRHAPRRGFDWSFLIVDQDAPNAFALPGGHIYVSRGLLILANTEDELANVLGHEVIHSARRHAAARQAVERSLPGPFRLLLFRYLASYSRAQEREADRLGQGLAGVAGFDPDGLAHFLKDLEFNERLRLGASRLPSFMDTHPATSQRAAGAAQRARMITWKPADSSPPTRADYLARLDGLVVGSSAEAGVFQGRRFLHRDLGLSILFPAGWTTHNTPRAVGAVAPERNAQVFLEFHGKGDDLTNAASEYLAEPELKGLRVERVQKLQIGPFPAFRVTGRASSSGGSLRIILTWIEKAGSIYRITGMALGGISKRHQSALLNVARSFRPLTAEQRRSIHVSRLRIASARQGESLGDLSERTRNEWGLQRTAVANDIFAGDSLEGGQLIKISVSELALAKRTPDRTPEPEGS